MKLKFSLSALALLVLLPASSAFAAATSVGVDVARGQSDSMAYSLRLAQKYQPWVENSLFELGPTAEIGGHAWVDDKDSVDTVWGAYLSPGVHFTLHTDAPVRPFISANVGGALNSEDHMDDRDFGSNLLFRTRGTVGVSFGEDYRHSIQGSYTHFSTWGIANTDDGYSTYGMSYNFSF